MASSGYIHRRCVRVAFQNSVPHMRIVYHSEKGGCDAFHVPLLAKRRQAVSFCIHPMWSIMGTWYDDLEGRIATGGRRILSNPQCQGARNVIEGIRNKYRLSCGRATIATEVRAQTFAYCHVDSSCPTHISADCIFRVCTRTIIVMTGESSPRFVVSQSGHSCSHWLAPYLVVLTKTTCA